MGYQPVKRAKKEKSRWLSVKELWRDILIWWNWSRRNENMGLDKRLVQGTGADEFVSVQRGSIFFGQQNCL